MKEVLPQFLVTDKRLIFTVPKATDSLDAAHQADMLELLNGLDMTEIQEVDTNMVITADLQPFLRKGVYTDADEKKLKDLLGPINHLFPYKSNRDVAVGLSTIGYLGPVVEIFPSFQTWLQSDAPNVDMLTASSLAMHEVFGLKPEKSITHWDVNIALENTEFSLVAHIDNEDAVIEKTGGVTLRAPFVQTLGDCACLGSSASNRTIFFHEEYADLYKLEPHNVDNLRQSLSMIVGLGTLASHMPWQFDEANLFGDIEWNEKSFPKNS